MAEGDKDPKQVEDETWKRTLYQLAHSDIRWAKEQSWRLVTWSLALLGGLIALYRYPLSDAPLWLFVKLSLAVAIAALVFLWNLSASAASARSICARIQASLSKDVLPESERYGPWQPDVYLALQALVVAIACALTIASLVHIKSHPLRSQGSLSNPEMELAGARGAGALATPHGVAPVKEELCLCGD